MFKPFLILAALLAATPSFADWHYRSPGKAISIDQAARLIASGRECSQIVFAENQMHIEFGEANKPDAVYAVSNTVVAFEKAVTSKYPAKIFKSGGYRYKLSWNKLVRLFDDNSGEIIYSAFDDFRTEIKSVKPERPFQNEEDARGYITYLWGPSYLLLSVVGPNVTWYASHSGDGGGAHPYAWNGMKHKNFGYGQDNLIELVDNQDLLNQLKGHEFFRKLATAQNKLERLDGVTQITDFGELARDLMEEGADTGTSWTSEPMAQFERFSVWDFDPATKKVTIRLGFEYISEVVRGSFSQVEITVNAKPEFAEQLEKVKTRQTEGQFMKDVPADQQPPMNGMDE